MRVSAYRKLRLLHDTAHCQVTGLSRETVASGPMRLNAGRCLRASIPGQMIHARLVGSHSSIGLPSGSCSLANRP
jgi:hypothetical protein